ncbi:hypothetical protein THAOC_06618 [Thalassiosira oceanica]|uniref:Uncharacterized protein n=1 Tax=Thalassiosira oceanica TaxID=159749 RepID=K0SZT4_THAOC|nr:hypothetical protein THAOC_06618 [Thalassiosira oceanica]|eukprot:EJK71898.1 hypothetical protein THAOC_06618 [Thalassiosira oceanica]
MSMTKDDANNIKGFFAIGQTGTLDDYCTHHGLSVDRLWKFISKSGRLKTSFNKHKVSASGFSRLESEITDDEVDRLFSQEEKRRIRKNELRKQRRAKDPSKDAQGWTRAPVEDIAAAAMPSTAHGLNNNSIDTIDTLRTVPNDCLHPSTPIFHACRGQTEINANCLSGSRRRAAPNRRIWTGPSAGTSPMTPSRTDNPRRPPGKVSDVAIDPSPPTS